MDELLVFQQPALRRPAFIFAFGGWPDAGEAATGAVRYLIQKLGAKKFAELDPEGFYDFTVMRPLVLTNRWGQREVQWPTLEFFYCREEALPRDLLFFLAVEPSFRWRAFTSAVLGLAERSGVNILVGLGALLDNVPHTREPKITGGATDPELQVRLREMGVAMSDYQGPTGIHSGLFDACRRREMDYVTLWGHAPYYIRGVANPKVALVLLQKLSALLELPLDLEEMEQQAVAFSHTLREAALRNPDLITLVRRLEEQEESSPAPPPSIPPGPLPGADILVRELEEFLRRQRRPGEEEA